MLCIIIAFFSILTFRLGYIQIIEGSKYSGISDKRRIKRRPLGALRGKIMDSNGVVLATNKHKFDVSIQYGDALYFDQKSGDALFPRLAKMKIHKKNSLKECKECHEEQEELFNRLLYTLEIDRQALLQKCSKIVKRVEKIKKGVSERNKKDIRVLEEISLHPIARDVDFKNVAKIEMFKDEFPNIFVEAKPYRWYPNKSMGAHIIGYTSELDRQAWKGYGFKDSPVDCNLPAAFSNTQKAANMAISSMCEAIDNKRTGIGNLFSMGYSGYVWAGKTGVEAHYNMPLLGNPGERFEEITCESSEIDRIIIERPSRVGENVFLTIDSSIQLLAETALGTQTGSIVVMNPWNGDVIAMASNPRFDPNTFNADFAEIIKDKRKPLLNRPAQSSLPPGSTFKIVTAIAALSEGAITPDTMLECYGWGGGLKKRFRCSSRRGHGMINVENALRHSCNVFFFKAAKKLGAGKLHKWSLKFGFGQRSGIDIPYERKGLLPKPKSVFETMNIAIGQGDLLASPLQITRMVGIVANGGRNIRPRLLKEIKNCSGDIIMKAEPEISAGMDIPQDVINVVKHGLIKVVSNGTARKVGIGKYKAAGKTGTAQTRKDNVNHAWFTGFAPYDAPEYCFTVLVERTPLHAAEATAYALRTILAGLFPVTQ